jgi:hypothetical protein
MSVHVLGIRHHGPGGARSLQKALVQLAPDCVLIEGPVDANHLISFVANKALKPPVALLLYNPKDFKQAAYFPFAEFSPEWVAMKYGLQAGVRVEFMDLPQGKQLALDAAEWDALPQVINEQDDADADIRHDPMRHIAQLAGYNDSERWWEKTFEHAEAQADLFPTILHLMTELRTHYNAPESKRTLMREAYMRQAIREAIAAGHQRIAVVCGAWHSPVLDVGAFKAADDKKLIAQGNKPFKTDAVWIPWTYERLAVSSGYGAGVVSPAWYKLLFHARKDVATTWMVEVARLFRAEDLDASSAHAIEGVRLAEALASMRGLVIPGIDELREAAIAIFCQGYESPMQLIEQKLIIGDAMGEVPKDLPTIPLQQDIEASIKKLRLKQHTEKAALELDLRKERDLAISHLLHRLLLLNISWGKKKTVGGNRRGSFHEHWEIKWKPTFALAIIEAGMWGNTLYSAATNYIGKAASLAQSLSELTDLVTHALHADLQEAIGPLIKQLQHRAALTKDVTLLMDILPPLVHVVRYGNVRNTDLNMVEKVLYAIVPRICIGLPSACAALDEQASREVFKKINNTNRSIGLLNSDDMSKEWTDTLLLIIQRQQANALLLGACTRLAFDKSLFSTPETSQQMSFALSSGNNPLAAAAWIEGFLHGSGLLLIHNIELWNILDTWVDTLPEKAFIDIVPLLRRTFSNFQPPERAKMLELARYGQLRSTNKTHQKSIHFERAAHALGFLHILLQPTDNEIPIS